MNIQPVVVYVCIGISLLALIGISILVVINKIQKNRLSSGSNNNISDD